MLRRIIEDDLCPALSSPDSELPFMSLVNLAATLLLAAPTLFAVSVSFAAPALFATPRAPKSAAIEPARAPAYPPSTAEAIIQGIYRDRARSEEWFHTNTQSFLAAVQRKDFGERASLTIGSAEDCDLRVNDGLFRPHHLRVTLRGDSFRVEAVDDSAQFRVAEAGPRDTTVGPGSLAIGKLGMLWGRYHVRLSHQRHPAIILFDGWSKRFSEYRGLKHFPADLKYRFMLPMEVASAPDTIQLASTRGAARPAVRLGWFNFMVGETRCRLAVIRMIEPGLPPDNMAVFFRDATSGKETAALGRYAEVRRLGNSDKYLLDFNLATNPACAFSDLYNCPVPPRENTLKVAILAGEKDLGYLTAKK